MLEALVGHGMDNSRIRTPPSCVDVVNTRPRPDPRELSSRQARNPGSRPAVGNAVGRPRGSHWGLKSATSSRLVQILRDSPRRDAMLISARCADPLPAGSVRGVAGRGIRARAGAGCLDGSVTGRALGFARTETLDLDGPASIQADLHDDPPAELVGAFDCVVDAGVLFLVLRIRGAALSRSSALPPRARSSSTSPPSPGATAAVTTTSTRSWLEGLYLAKRCDFVRSAIRTKFRARAGR